jgi:hypothetical protein
MPYEITNTQRSASIIRVADAGTATVSLANLAVDANETVSAANIRRLTWSTNGNIQIIRNSVPVLMLHNSGTMMLDELNHSVANNNASPIVITIATGGSIVMEVTKVASYTTALTGM